MSIYVLPLWGFGLLGCWIPWLITRDKTDPGFGWVWILFGITCLPMAIVFAIVEKPAEARARFHRPT